MMDFLKRHQKTTFRVMTAFTPLIFLLAVYALLPKPKLEEFKPYSQAIYDTHGELLKLYLADDDKYRLKTAVEDISSDVIRATILYEDQHYYHHNGVDFLALARAAWQTYIVGSRRIGASTLPMQVARLRWNINTRTITGKLIQILRAIQLSRHYDKNDILTAYFNLAPYGGNVEGIAAASLIYFNKSPNELNLHEALTLAVIPQNPNKRNPNKETGYNTLVVAKRQLALRYHRHYDNDTALKTVNLPININSRQQLPSYAPHFTRYIKQQMPNYHYGNVHSTLDLQKQLTAEQIIKHYIQKNAAQGIKNAAALVVNTDTANVEVMVGSADFNNITIQGQVNGTNAKRSPGSTLKPFVYGLAIDEGLIHPLTILADTPRQYGGFSPENYDQRFLGPINATQALILSRNVPAVDLQAKLSTSTFHDFLSRAGVKGLKSASHYGLALALGGGELTMLELASLYNMLLNQGQYRPLNTTTNTLQSEKNTHAITLLSPESSFLVLDMLRQNPAPKNYHTLNFNNNTRDIPWKTGTSWAFRDAWAVAATGQYVIATWVGNFDNTSNPAFVGATAAGPLLFSLIEALTPNDQWSVDQLWLQNAYNLQQVPICHASGNLMQKYCPAEVLGWFIPGVSPIKSEPIYKAIAINSKTQLRACLITKDDTTEKVYAFWPSEFLSLYAKAGIALNKPPQYSPECTLNDRQSQGHSPVIVSPHSPLIYIHNAQQPILLKADHDSDVKQLYWFINQQYLGVSSAYKQLYWDTSPGNHTVTVIDDNGRASHTRLTVRADAEPTSE